MQRKPPSFGRQKGYRQFRPISGSLFDWKMLQGLLSPVICEVVLARKYLRVWYLTALRGSEFPVSPLFYRRALEGIFRYTVLTPTVLIGGVPALPVYSVLSPQFVSEYQIGVLPAPNTPTGDTVPLQIQIGGVTTTDQVTIAVSP
jgi:hypothetical protein